MGGVTTHLSLSYGLVITLGLLMGSCNHGQFLVAGPPEEPKVKFHLPSHCRHLYNDGTDAWIECMGVGYK